jgi:tRNA-specific 2-thiouridylase
MKYAQQKGYDALVTGHYASLRPQPSGHNALFRGADRKKDQSYFLFGLTQEQLDFSCFPLGDMTKDQVRSIVTELDLPNASDPESQDICFATPDQSVGELLRQTFDG